MMKAYSEALFSEKCSQPFMLPLSKALNSCLGELLAGSNPNGAVFREAGGASVIMELVKSDKSRGSALALVQQLILASGGEEDMTSLLELLHSTPQTNVNLKTDILRTLSVCLRESHRARAVFRRAGGFVYVISVLVSLEGSLAEEDPKREQWKSVDSAAVFYLLQSVFTCLAVAMRFEPANAKFFQVEMNCGSSMAETVKLLGCFSAEKTLPEATKKTKEQNDRLLKDLFHDDKIYAFASTTSKTPPQMPKSLLACVVVLRMLYDMAIDNHGRAGTSPASTVPSSPMAKSAQEGDAEEKEEENKSKKIPNLNLTPSAPYPVIVHAGMVTTVLKLIPALYRSDHHDLSVSAQLFAAEIVKSLLRTDRNQQIMCDVGLVSDIMGLCRPVLEDEAHILHSSFHYLLERLSAQKLDPSDLRTFFRLGNPLACLNDEERQRFYAEKPANQKPGSFIPLTRIKTLVSMTTPRDIHVQTNSIMPPFVEFDMSSEGFGCLFLASVAPSSSHPPSVVGVSSAASQEGNVIGGIGQGDRAFPPTPGFTYSTWVCVDKFSDPRSDPHPVRLLTLTRHLRGGGEKQEEQESNVCLAICLSARDKAVIISTQESKPKQLTFHSKMHFIDNTILF